MRISELAFNNNITSLGAILGTTGSQTLIDDINAQCGGGSYFGNPDSDPFRTGFINFMNTVITPIRQTNMILQEVSQKLNNPNVYRSITSAEDLRRGIPQCMELGIIYYAPVRQMLEEERISGFGIDPKTLEDKDPFEDLINSGRWVGTSEDIQGDSLEINFYENSTDPNLTYEEIRHLDNTRQFLDDFMSDPETKYLDPTDPNNLHG